MVYDETIKAVAESKSAIDVSFARPLALTIREALNAALEQTSP
jgi:hypothetical protein